MFLATQYYRPPFPARDRWVADLRAIKAAGLEAIGLWAVWAWVEPSPGTFCFTDLDELIGLAAREKLDVIITAVGEIQPYWIHREVPDGHFVDHEGRRIISSTLSYNPHGLTPGACTDHPAVRELLARYLQELGRRYAGLTNLRCWDCWNEIRVALQIGGFYCYCEHTLAAYRRWLQARHGSLEGLNETWHRRFTSWSDVPAGRGPGRNWTEFLEWQRFLEHRTAELLRLRVSSLRTADSTHPIMAHSVVLSSFMQQGESEWDPPGARGNEWELAESLDAFGASHFPAWFHTLPSEYGARLESTRSAAGSKPHWVSELQGGGARTGLDVMKPVSASQQQRWVWMAFGRGVQCVNFWCWRDEVFGRESSGFGVIGDDGHALERVRAITHATQILRKHRRVLESYRPSPARVGVIFDTLNHQLEWAQYGKASEQSGRSIKGYLQALERLVVPYDVLDAARSGALAPYRMLILPWPMIVRPELASALESWLRHGGVLLTESELASFDAYGFYTYPGERAFARALGVTGQGRRPLPHDKLIDVKLGSGLTLRAASWIEPLTAPGSQPIAKAGGETVGVAQTVGQGEVLVLGTHAGLAYSRERYTDFETFLRLVLQRAGATPDVTCSVSDGDVVQFRYGAAGDQKLLFITNEGDAAEVTFHWHGPAAPRAGTSGRDLLTGRNAVVSAENDGVRVDVRLDAGGSHVLLFTQSRHPKT